VIIPLLAEIVAASALLLWNPSPDAVSYRLYISIQPINGDRPIQWYSTTGTSYEVTGMDFGTTYYFRATAFNAAGIESTYSNEATYTPVPPPEATPTPLPTPEPTPTPIPTPEDTPDNPGKHKGWFK
jgi:hypothetical protein